MNQCERPSVPVFWPEWLRGYYVQASPMLKTTKDHEDFYWLLCWSYSWNLRMESIRRHSNGKKEDFIISEKIDAEYMELMIRFKDIVMNLKSI